VLSVEKQMFEATSGSRGAGGDANRVFIVGCPRSGTTALQSLLANHTVLAGFPESNILYRFLGDIPVRRYRLDRVIGRANLPRFMLNRYLQSLGCTLHYDPRWLEEFLVSIGREDVLGLVPRKLYSLRRSFEVFVSVFDCLAGGGSWVDKSPENIFCVDEIDQYVPNAWVVHIVREGRDAVASCVAVGRKYRAFEGRFGGSDGVRRAVLYWNNAVLASRACAGRANHFLLRYEDFVEDPRGTLSPICKAIGISLDEQDPTYNLRGIAAPAEVWKVRETHAIRKAESRFEEVLDSVERRYVEANILPVEDLVPRTRAVTDA
jgi:hypothetical protein